MTDRWPVLDCEVEYDPGWIRAGYDRVRRPDGEVADYYWAGIGGDAVAVVATDGDRVVMVEQYRPKLRDSFVEVPGGALEDGDSFEAAARRELREETGYRADSVQLLQTYYPAGFARLERGIVVAEGLQAGEADTDDGEFISVRRVPVEEALAIARRQGSTGWTLTSLLLARSEGYL